MIDVIGTLFGILICLVLLGCIIAVGGFFFCLIFRLIYAFLEG